jgi:murein DD-endopeptidase MepM/ murein hydrolase activator NlpD
VITTAFVGAGIVALGAGAAMPDAKADANSLDGLDSSVLAEFDRSTSVDQASRSDRTGGASNSVANASDAWLLPLHDYTFTSPSGIGWDKTHKGVDLAAPEGTTYNAVHGGKVILAKWFGGYGNCIMIDHGNGLMTVYGHSSQLLVKEGDTVTAGQAIGLVGNTGHSFGSHLHMEIHVNGVAVDPLPWFKTHGVDLKLEMEQVY